jgi:aminoglycoside 3-N-acetyltransferase
MAAYDPVGKSRIGRLEMTSALRKIGVRPGMLLQVHSSLSKLGYVAGGAETVVDALLDAVAPDGTVMVPTFNHGAAEIYDARTTPSTNGAVTEALRKRPQARRSVHPTHPYAAIGPAAEELTAGNLEVGTFDPRSPLGKLAAKGGYVLLLGIGMQANTAAHIGEHQARVHCIGFDESPHKVRLEDGQVITAMSVIWRNGACLIEWEPLEEQMRLRGMIRDGRLGDGHLMLMRAQDVIDVTYAMTFEMCPMCPTRPLRRTQKTEAAANSRRPRA